MEISNVKLYIVVTLSRGYDTVTVEACSPLELLEICLRKPSILLTITSCVHLSINATCLTKFQLNKKKKLKYY